MGLQLEIITPEYVIYNGEVDSVTVPGKNGKFQMLQNHAPIVATMEGGDVVVRTSQKAKTQHKSLKEEGGMLVLNVSGGTLELNNNQLIILADQ